MMRKWWTLAAVSIGIFMLLLDITIVNVALPDIQRQLHASISDLQWVIDAYALSLAALLLTAGSLADLVGRRVVFATGIAIFTAGSLLCGVAQSPLFLSLARAGQGVGGAIMFATSLALLAHAFRGPDRGIAFGVFGAITGIAVAAGPVLGGAITSGLFVAVDLLHQHPDRRGRGRADTAARRRIPRPGREPPRLAWLSDLQLGARAARVRADRVQHAPVGIRSRHRVARHRAAAAGHVRRHRGPTTPADVRPVAAPQPDVRRRPGISVRDLRLSLHADHVPRAVPPEHPRVLGDRHRRATARTQRSDLPHRRRRGAADRKLPTRLLISPGFVLIGTGLLLMRGLSTASGWMHLLPGLILVGAGVGLVSTPLASTAVGVVHPARAGMASGINTTFRQIGVAAGVAGLGSIFANQIRNGVTSSLAGTPLARSAHQLATAVSSKNIAQILARAPHAARARLAAASTSSFVHALNDILLIAAIVAFAGVAVALTLIRRKDFVDAPEKDTADALDGAQDEAAPPGLGLAA